MIPGTVLTNGTTVKSPDEKVVHRQFRLIAIDGNYAWVMALNGHFAGERLTFSKENLMTLETANQLLKERMKK